jgi:hypothetical protein
MRSAPLKPDEIRKVPGFDDQFFSSVRWHPDFVTMGSEVIDDILVYLHRSVPLAHTQSTFPNTADCNLQSAFAFYFGRYGIVRDMSQDIEKDESEIPKTPIRFWWHVMRGHTKYLALSLFALTVAQGTTTSVPFIIRGIIDTATNAWNGVGQVQDVWVWVVIYIGAMATMFAGWRLSGFIGSELVTRISATAYKILFTYLTRHSYTYFADRFAGSLSSKVTHASEGV